MPADDQRTTPPRALRPRSLRGWFVVLLIVIACAYTALALVGCIAADRLIFQPRPSSYTFVAGMVKLTSADGQSIAALHLPNPQAKYTILYSHGNAEDIGDLLPMLEMIRDAGFAVFVYDYQGYGASEGKPAVARACQDADAAYGYLTAQLGVPPERIIAHGRSLGGGMAVDVAARRPVAGLILESSFVSVFRVVTRWPLLPFDKLKNIKRIGGIHCPVLVIHGVNDGLIPVWHGRKLYAAANEPKQCLWVEGAGHNTVFQAAGPKFAQALTDFRDRVDRTSTLSVSAVPASR